MKRATMTTMLTGAVLAAAATAGPVWPPDPAPARVAWEGEILCGDLREETGFFGKVGRLIGGGGDEDRPAKPFDVEAVGDHLFVTCQDQPVLVRIDPEESSYRIYECEDRPLVTPIGLAARNEVVYVADSGAGAVYRLRDGDLEPFITEGLLRPTGVALLPGDRGLLVVDTGDHTAKIYDFEGGKTGELQSRGESDAGFNFPTFAAEAPGAVLVNDTMNYRIKRFGRTGDFLGAFGEEGDGPGTFARPKGLTADGEGNVWVVDALFDNVQVFAPDGRLLLVIGSTGQAPGEFWSPGGITARDERVYVADTFNNRIQVLRILGGGS